MSGNFSTSTLPMTGSLPPAVDLGSRPGDMKSATAYRTISEVASDLSVPQHVLRFWETKFPQIKPLKRGGGRRYYRPEDVMLINGIKDFLYNQGYTIRGVQQLLKEKGRFPSARSMVPDPQLPSSMIALNHALPSSAPVLEAPAPLTSARGLSLDKRRQVELMLNELKAMRQLLKQSGI